MVTVIKRTVAHFRIDIREVKTGKTKTISLGDHSNKTLEDIKQIIVAALEKSN